MTTRRRVLRRALLSAMLVGGALAAGPVPGAGADPEIGPQPPARFELTVVPHQGRPVTATLTCDPSGGTHPRPAEACWDLHVAGGDFADLPGDDSSRACPDVWEPVTAAAVGTWYGERVEFKQTYGNACVLRAETGPVFQLARFGTNA